jgi:hypothetical protein
MAAKRSNQSQICELCDWGRGYMNRRWNGSAPVDVNDLYLLQERAGISMHCLLTGEVDCTVTQHPHEAVSSQNFDGPNHNDDTALSHSTALPNPADYLRNRILGHRTA